MSENPDLCKLGHLAYPTSSDPIVLNDRNLSVDDGYHDNEATLTELTSVYTSDRGEYPSPVSGSGDSGFDQDGSDEGACSDSGMGSPVAEVQWEYIVDGPLPPVTDILHSRTKDTDCANLPMLIKPEPFSDYSDPVFDCMDCSSPTKQQQQHHQQQYYLALNLPFTPQQRQCAYINNTTTSSNHHDYTTMPGLDNNNNHNQCYNNNNNNNNNHNNNNFKMEVLDGGPTRRPTCSKMSASAARADVGDHGRLPEKGIRKKPGRKKGQVSKVLHLWEFIRDLLGDPNYCPRIIHWENEQEGVFRVLQSSEVARLWGEKKKNKKTMTYEKLSRSLRYSRKEGYFDSLPKSQGYPKKLCFKFGPKSHGWREYALH